VSKSVFEAISRLSTENRNPLSERIDELPSNEILKLINSEDAKVSDAVHTVIPKIARVTDKVYQALKGGYRLIYIGAGTSGRLGVLDAAECPPTFGTDPQQIIGLIAGGKEAMFVAQEGAEDSHIASEQDLSQLNLVEGDVLIGLAASGRTPYVVSSIKYAKSIGCFTSLICTVPEQQALSNGADPDIIIDCVVGPEVVTGSTRMKSGTAQKMIMNMITTTAMIQLGKTLGNVMVDLQPTNTKLVERSKKTIMELTGLSYEDAQQLLEKAEYHVKSALIIYFTGCRLTDAKNAISHVEGRTKKAIEYINNSRDSTSKD